ncbi:MAG: hypothetical protein J0I93_04090 [Legionella sp.]|nr:hypothetical protein [Legionella sp.]
MTTDSNLLVGIFYDKQSADNAYQLALDSGYEARDINIIMSQASMDRYAIDKDDNLSPTSAGTMIGTGGAIGGSVGGILGAIAALGTNVFFPALGLIIAGPLAGIVSGTLMGTLLGLNISEIQAQDYQDQIDKGAIILTLEKKEGNSLESQWRALEQKSKALVTD